MGIHIVTDLFITDSIQQGAIADINKYKVDMQKLEQMMDVEDSAATENKSWYDILVEKSNKFHIDERTSFLQQVCKTLGTETTKNDLMDVQFVVGNDKFYGSRFYLSKCEYFAALFANIELTGEPARAILDMNKMEPKWINEHPQGIQNVQCFIFKLVFWAFLHAVVLGILPEQIMHDYATNIVPLYLYSKELKQDAIAAMCEKYIDQLLNELAEPKYAGLAVPIARTFQQFSSMDAKIEAYFNRCKPLLAVDVRLVTQREFLDFSMDSVLQVVQASELEIPEVQLFQRVVEWATHQAGTNTDPAQVRALLAPVLPFIQFENMEQAQIFNVVYPAKVLSEKEIIEVLQIGAIQKSNPPYFLFGKEHNTTRSRKLVQPQQQVSQPAPSSTVSNTVQNTPTPSINTQVPSTLPSMVQSKPKPISPSTPATTPTTPTTKLVKQELPPPTERMVTKFHHVYTIGITTLQKANGHYQLPAFEFSCYKWFLAVNISPQNQQVSVYLYSKHIVEGML